MAYVYLVLAIVGAAFAYLVWRPLRGGANGVGFLVGWLYGELAVHHILIQLGITAAFAALGWLDAPAGRLGLAIAAASWAALAVHWLTSFGAAARVESALARAFGPSYLERIAPETRARLRRELDWPRIAWPFSPRRGRAVRRGADVHFARVGAIDLRLDVYAPIEPGERRPVLLQIHGGGWTIGTKNTQALPLMYHMAERGWICVATSYRLSPRATFPDHMIDCKRALAWIRAHIAEYGGDPDFVVATGGSAGGHLCSLLALTPNMTEYQPGFESADTTLQGCVPFYGIYDFTSHTPRPQHAPMGRLLAGSVMKTTLDANPEGYRLASPMWRLRADAPPFLIVHGDSDSLVAVEDARDFSELLAKESSAPVAYLEIAGAQHAFEIFDSVRAQYAIHAVERFCSVIHSDHRARRARG
jgi:acetyl esterase/lipase